jgi:hypothetical protein
MIFAHTREPGRRVDPYPVCEGCKAWHHEGQGRFPLGQGHLACGGTRPCPGGTMVQGPRGATLQGSGALGLDALPVTRGTSSGCPFPPLFLATRIGLCGRAGLSTVGSSHTITREGLTSHGSSAIIYLNLWYDRHRPPLAIVGGYRPLLSAQGACLVPSAWLCGVSARPPLPGCGGEARPRAL